MHIKLLFSTLRLILPLSCALCRCNGTDNIKCEDNDPYWTNCELHLKQRFSGKDTWKKNTYWLFGNTWCLFIVCRPFQLRSQALGGLQRLAGAQTWWQCLPGGLHFSTHPADRGSNGETERSSNIRLLQVSVWGSSPRRCLLSWRSQFRFPVNFLRSLHHLPVFSVGLFGGEKINHHFPFHVCIIPIRKTSLKASFSLTCIVYTHDYLLTVFHLSAFAGTCRSEQ